MRTKQSGKGKKIKFGVKGLSAARRHEFGNIDFARGFCGFLDTLHPSFELLFALFVGDWAVFRLFGRYEIFRAVVEAGIVKSDPDFSVDLLYLGYLPDR